MTRRRLGPTKQFQKQVVSAPILNTDNILRGNPKDTAVPTQRTRAAFQRRDHGTAQQFENKHDAACGHALELSVR